MNSEAELRYSANTIDARGGVGPWHNRNRHCSMIGVETHEHRLAWLKAVWGGSCSRQYKADLDENGKDWCRRHTKKRLYKLANKVEDLAEQELRWMEEKLQNGESLAEIPRLVQIYSISAAALLYYRMLKSDGCTTNIEDDNTAWARKRGTEWQVATHPDYPPDLKEPEDANSYHHLTADQHEFVESHIITRPEAERFEFAICVGLITWVLLYLAFLMP